MILDFFKPRREAAAPAQLLPPHSSQDGGDISSMRGGTSSNGFGAQSFGFASEAVRVNMDDFGKSLEEISRLPDRFRQLMDPVETVLKTMALLRNRVEGLESSLSTERGKYASASGELAKLKSQFDRQATTLRAEESNVASLRDQLSNSEANVSLLRHENSELSARLSRIEPRLREVTVLNEAQEAELEKFRALKAQSDEDFVQVKSELANALERLTERDDLVASLSRANESQTERLEEMSNTIASLQLSLNATSEKLSQTTAVLIRERNSMRALRAEHEHLGKERQEIVFSFETKLDAARSRASFVEKLLEEARSRFQEETRQLSHANRIRAERDSEISRLTLALEAARRESAELRSSVNAASESAAASNGLLNTEIEARRRVEHQVEILRAENSALTLKLEAAKSAFTSTDATMSQTTGTLQSKIAELMAENQQLKSSLDVARGRLPSDYLADLSEMPNQESDSKVVPLRQG